MFMMGVKVTLLLLLLYYMCNFKVVSGEGDFSIIAPRWIRQREDFVISVIIINKTVPDVTVKIGLYHSTKNSTLIEKQETYKSGSENQMTLKIGKVTGDQYSLTAIGSGGLQFNKQAIVSVSRTNMIILVQTDKAIYQPGQKVLFRIMGVNNKLKPYTGTFKVTIKDSESNKLRVTNEKRVDRRECELVYSDEFQLADETPLGTWTILVETDTETTSKRFTVEEYVLPKIEVKVLLGSFYHHSMGDLTGTVQAKYTYGQPVKGTAQVEIYISRYWKDSKRYKRIVKNEELVNGEAVVTITQKEILGLYKCTTTWCIKNNYTPKITDYPYRYATYYFDATVTEKATGEEFKAENSIRSRQNPLIMDFLSISPRNFKIGITWTGFMRLTRADGTMLLPDDKKSKDGKPLKIEVEIFYKDGRVITREKEKKLFDVTDDGIIPIQFLTKKKSFYYVDIDVTYPHEGEPATGAGKLFTSYLVEQHNTKSRKAIQVSMEDVEGIIQPSNKPVTFLVETSEKISSFYYQIVSRRIIVKTEKVSASGVSNTFQVLFDKDFAHMTSPSAKVIVWYYHKKLEMLVDSIQIKVDGTFINDVSLKLSKPQVKPGESLTVHTKSDPNSCTGILAVDKSVLLLKRGNDLTRSSVTDVLYRFDSAYIRPYYRWWYYPVYMSGYDTKEIIQNAGIVVLTDAYIHDEPQAGWVCHWPFGFDRGIFSFGDMSATSTNQDSRLQTDRESSTEQTATEEVQKDEIRDLFPETWLWLNLFTGNNGRVEKEVTAPDTITSWVFSAFSVNKNSGIGIMNNTKELTVFKPCFTDLRLPFSAIRLETLQIQAVVFNYLKKKQKMKVVLKSSNGDAFYATGNRKQDPDKVQEVGKTVQILPNDGRELNFYIKPVKLGELPVEIHITSNDCSDALRKNLNVEPEGEPVEYSKGLFFGLDEGKDSDTVVIEYPPDTVEGSQRVVVTAIGDIMGPSIYNVDHLIRKPYGCGEQNMITFAPNIYVLDYLSSSGQLSQGTEKKLKRFMEIGYQRELTFQRHDGSFSAFGPRDKSGSLWMTSFVIRCFQQARSYISIDQNIINEAVTFILKQQETSGKFKEPLTAVVSYRYLQGGISSHMSLTAYVAKVLQEVKPNLTPIVKNMTGDAIKLAQGYLEKRLKSIQIDSYSLSLTCYFLTNVSSNKAGRCLQYLEILAIKTSDKVYWKRVDIIKYKYWRSRYFWPSSNSVEMTAYVLLTYCMKGNIDKAAPIARWLSTVRSYWGGYSSTQDTIVGLQALATYAAKLPSASKKGVDVKLSWTGGRHSFNTIRPKNRDILQQFKIPDGGSLSSIKVQAEGSGTALVQINVFFNKNSSLGAEGFKLTAEAIFADSVLKLKICLLYSLNVSGMVIIEVKMLTSYQPQLSNLLDQHDNLKKVQYNGNRLALYFDTLPEKSVCVTVKLTQISAVRNLKSALITVYSYYEPEIRDSVLYLPEGKAED